MTLEHLIRWRQTAVMAAVVIFVQGCTSVKPVSDDQDTLFQQASFKDYHIEIYKNYAMGSEAFQIFQNHEPLYYQTGVEFKIGQLNDEETNVVLKMGRCITGNGQPDLVVSEWTGGGHCCGNYQVLEIGNSFKLLGKIDVEDNDGAVFQDLRRDGNLELSFGDYTFAYWHTGFSSSPAPEVVLHYVNGKYDLDQGLMRKPTPSASELSQTANELRTAFTNQDSLASGEGWQAPPEVWGEMLDLIYSGNIKSAWQLLDQSWPPSHPGKSKFLTAFKAQLAESPYFTSIMKLNGQ